jgi:hypothetical protein
MAARRTSTDRIERFAARIDTKLRADAESSKSMRVFTDSSLRRVLLDCGFERRGARNVERIEAALEQRRVFADPPLTTPGLDWEQRIHFTRSPQTTRLDEHRVGFRTEYDLETFLVDNFEYVFPGLRLVDRQYAVQSGQVDILAKDDDGYVVIELKKDQPTERLVSQLIRYMDDVAAWLAERGDAAGVRGLVVTEQADDRMHGMLVDLAATRGSRIDWMEYRVELVLRPVGIVNPVGA